MNIKWNTVKLHTLISSAPLHLVVTFANDYGNYNTLVELITTGRRERKRRRRIVTPEDERDGESKS